MTTPEPTALVRPQRANPIQPRPGLVTALAGLVAIPAWIVFSVQFAHSFFGRYCEAGECQSDDTVVSGMLVLWGLVATVSLLILLGGLFLMGLSYVIRGPAVVRTRKTGTSPE
jgi:hypothetical protein